MKNKKLNKIRIYSLLATVLFFSFVNLPLALAECDPCDPLDVCYDPASCTSDSTGSGWDPQALGSFNLPGGTISDIIIGVLNFLLAIIGAMGVIGFLISGILYLTAAGDEDQAKKAKRAMTYSIYGILIALAGFVIIQAAYGLLQGKFGKYKLRLR